MVGVHVHDCLLPTTDCFPDSADETKEGFSKGCVKFYHENYYEEQLNYEPLPLTVQVLGYGVMGKCQQWAQGHRFRAQEGCREIAIK